MNSTPSNSSSDSIRAMAASWTIRRDRGLSAAESIEYELWLAADPRHAAAMQRSTDTWSLLDRLPESAALPVLAAATRRRAFWRRTVVATGVAAAAALVLSLFVSSRHTPAAAAPEHVVFVATSAPRTLTLSDGSVVQLNTGSEVVERFTAEMRQVVLTRGEAHFNVTKNPARPFIVRAGSLEVRAVGTAFNVNLQSSAIDVIVTEGRVQLSASSAPAAAVPALDAGERAVLRPTAGTAANFTDALTRTRPDPMEIADALAWREPLLRLGGATLAELAIEFERSTGKRLIFADPSLAELRFGGRFRSDDVEGFTQVLAATLDLQVEHAADGTFVLRKKNSLSR